MVEERCVAFVKPTVERFLVTRKILNHESALALIFKNEALLNSKLPDARNATNHSRS